MKTVTVNLSSSSAGGVYQLNELILTDITQLIIDLYNVECRDDPPLFLNIQWGDESDPLVEGCNFSASLLKNNAINAITQAQNIQQYDILLNKYSHTYATSQNCLTKILSCYISIDHLITDSTTKFIIPIKIISPSYYKKVGDVILLQTNIIPRETVMFTLGTEIGSYVVETALDMSTLN